MFEKKMYRFGKAYRKELEKKKAKLEKEMLEDPEAILDNMADYIDICNKLDKLIYIKVGDEIVDIF